MISTLTEGPQVLVGSSMGGWIALLVAQAMPERMAGLVGIAAAPDFHRRQHVGAGSPTAQRAALLRDGQIELPSDYSDEPYVITRRLIEEGRAQLVLRDAADLPFPVRLLQGTADVDVPPAVALRLLDHAHGPRYPPDAGEGRGSPLFDARVLSMLICGRTCWPEGAG